MVANVIASYILVSEFELAWKNLCQYLYLKLSQFLAQKSFPIILNLFPYHHAPIVSVTIMPKCI